MNAEIFVLHENDDWVVPLRAALAARGLPHRDWHLDRGRFVFEAPPPAGVFYNRMSASSHTRGHRWAPEYTACVLEWLERHGRRVVNTSRALQLELSKIAQYAALNAAGIRTPRTAAAVTPDDIVAAAADFEAPFITKHNRAGKGLGVSRFESVDALRDYVHGAAFEPSVDGITLVQDYIAVPEPFITRVEFVGGQLVYAARVETSRGFELCPADVCQADDAFCPADDGADDGADAPETNLFTVLPDFDHPLVAPYRRFLAANGIEIAGIEFIVDQDGTAYTYDVNTNTNYNAPAEAAAGVPGRGMGAIADFLGGELRKIEADPVARIAAR